MRQVSTDLYQFNDLNDGAKETARAWYRQGALDYEWYDCVYDDAKTIGALMGIEITNIYFSGFWSQGDGACFEGSYAYKAGSVAAVKAYAPNDATLYQIANDLRDIQRPSFYQLEASVEHRGHYSHEMCTSISVYRGGMEEGGDTESAIQEALRDFMRWIYRQLEADYDYLMSDESVDECLQINEYEFDENGNIA